MKPAVLHKSLTMKHCFRLHFITPRQAAKAPQYEAAPVFILLRRGKPFHSDMKHSAYAPYDLSSIALCATDDEKIKNESFCRQYMLCSADDVKGDHCSQLVFERTRHGLWRTRTDMKSVCLQRLGNFCKVFGCFCQSSYQSVEVCCCKKYFSPCNFVQMWYIRKNIFILNILSTLDFMMKSCGICEFTELAGDFRTWEP